MKEAIKALISPEIQSKSMDVALDTIELLFNSATDPTQPISPAAIARVGMTVMSTVFEYKDKFVQEKLLSFFEQAQASSYDIHRFKKKLDKDEDTFTKSLLVTLERLEEKEKSQILGRVFRALLDEKIDIEDFQQVSYSIDHVYLPMLKVMVNKEVDKGTSQYKVNGRQLSAINIMWEDLKVEVTHGGSSPLYTFIFTNIGQIIIKHGLCKMDYRF
jgi:hypothetical protein